MKLKLGFVGAGNMAGAIIGGILREKLLPPEQIGVFDISEDKMAPYKQAGHPVFAGVEALTAACEKVVLAVKPQQFGAVLPQVAAGMDNHTLLISIAAGITAETIQDAAGFPCKVVLVMPNTPLLLGRGATALSRVEPTTIAEFEEVRGLFAAAGMAREIPPDRMSEVIPVNGSSPAFLYHFAEIIQRNAEAAGLDGETALELFCQTMIGSAHMLLESGSSPRELIDMVCSPGGTTLAAIKALEEKGFAPAVDAAFAACVGRARELAESGKSGC